ncbi:helix-turn-helix transcriptional regulator [Bradyrhizobium sp. IC3195]|uniref:helix-turn-helix domain-containing protein n=1 Tax=Bradyrhizobium sp. IC3195 TaxID=2793804 RepID=UPI001CD2D40C|nr:helix-turn-helix transcriptional regulator [Bradyrhizobium sp. IC3195]MCA1469253.1 helix-turn-helix transcriptional regulator [Bradyrhizobium sp. IC3195]
MEKSLKSAEYARLMALLVATRHKAGIRQHTLAKKLRKPQSFVAKYEGGERRLDIIEFIAIADALGADPLNLLRRFIRAGAKKQ